MRIVAGQARGRKLTAPKDDRIRPTSDRVRQSLFDLLGPVEGLRVLDPFAGTGALGLEALSRGAAFVEFGDIARDALELVRRNAEALGYLARCRIHRLEAPRLLERLARDATKQDLVFLDPPYHRFDLAYFLALPNWTQVLSPGARVVVECDVDAWPTPDPLLWQECDRRRYGGTGILLLALRSQERR